MKTAYKKQFDFILRTVTRIVYTEVFVLYGIST